MKTMYCLGTNKVAHNLCNIGRATRIGNPIVIKKTTTFTKTNIGEVKLNPPSTCIECINAVIIVSAHPCGVSVPAGSTTELRGTDNILCVNVCYENNEGDV